jgi:hypothetical protein
VFQQSSKPADGYRSFTPEGLHLIRISVHLLVLRVAWERLLFIGLVFYAMVPWLPLLLSKRALSQGALRYHQLYHKRFLLL